jgi:peptidyl-prolyl cis-trans isomerase SurA
MLASPLHAASPDPFSVAAVVGDVPLTHYDIQQRMRFLIATTGLKVNEKTSAQLAGRVMNTLIEEQLQLQAGKKSGITASAEDIAAAIARIEADNKKEAGSLRTFLERQEIDPTTLETQIAAQLVWSKYLQRTIVPSLQISDSELSRYIQQFTNKQRSIEEVQVASIDIPNLTLATEQFKADDAAGLAEALTAQLRAGVDFNTLAKQLSSTSPVSVAGAQWIPLKQLPPELGTMLRTLTPPAVLNPFKTPSGYQILLVQDKRTVDYRTNAEILLKEIILKLAADASAKEVDVLMAIARTVRKDAGSCTMKDVSGVTDLQGLEFEVNYSRTKLAELSSQLFPLIRGLQVGDTSEPFATPEGIRLLTLCEKIELPMSDTEKERLSVQLKEEKLRLEATRLLRTLRRDSYIDIRG